jgi:poly-gamma-glutamate synthesis protein (capsule biosynthesis protein)
MNTLKILLTGDVMTGRSIDQVLPHPGSPLLYEPHIRDARDYVRLAERVCGPIEHALACEDLWGDALAEMQRLAPDLRIVNLETAVTTCDDAWPDKGIHYRMHPANMGCLTAAGIDCCVLANNHLLDWSREGLAETLRTLHAAGMHTAGAGADAAAAWAPAVLPVPGGAGRVLVFACATESSGVPPDWAATERYSGVALLPDLSEASARRLATGVASERRAGEPVVVSIHWGANWGESIPAAHRAFAHRLIELGAADVVHGHSSHHPLAAEVYRGRLVLYGCGDLINDYEGIGPHGDLRSDVGCLYFATLEAQGGALQRLEIVPLQIRRLRLEAADAQARLWVERLFNRGGRALGTQVTALPGSSGWALQWQPGRTRSSGS